MDRLKLNPDSLNVEAFEPSADPAVAAGEDTISGCPTSCACCGG